MTQIAAADERVLLWINSLAGRFPLLDTIMRLVVNDYFIPVSLSLILLGLWFWGKNIEQRELHQRAFMAATASLGISCGMVKIANLFYDRPRPFEQIHLADRLMPTVERIFYSPTDSSFPSNAAAIAFATAAVMWISRQKIVAGFLCFLTLLMSFARIYAGVHYPLDIVGGIAIAIIISYFVTKVVFPLAEPLPTLVLKLLRKLCLA